MLQIGLLIGAALVVGLPIVAAVMECNAMKGQKPEPIDREDWCAAYAAAERKRNMV